MNRAVTNRKNVTALATVVVSMLLAASPGNARADVVYTYTGNDFTTFYAPYTGSDYVTLSITLSTPLPPNFVFQLVTPLSFTASDGVQTITNTDAAAAPIALSTNSLGAITEWGIAIYGPAYAGVILTNSYPGDYTDRGSNPVGNGENLNDPGTWSVPEPSSLAIIAAAMTVLGSIRRRRPDRLPGSM